MSGTYTPGISSASTKIPVPQYSITTFFSSSPENVEPLTRAVFAVIDSLQKSGPSQADVDKVKEELLRTHELELKQNTYWVSMIQAHDQNGDDIAGVLAQYDVMVRRMTPADVQQAAKLYFNTKNYVRVVLLP
jgi:zinc protease